MSRQEKRDMFAAACLNACIDIVTKENIRRQLLGHDGLNTQESCATVARVAYNIADAMLAESEKREATI